MERLSAEAADSQPSSADRLHHAEGTDTGIDIGTHTVVGAVVESDEDEEDEGDLSDPEPVTQPPAFFAPLIGSIRSWLPESVYPPSDDTFLVLQTVLDDLHGLRDRR